MIAWLTYPLLIEGVSSLSWASDPSFAPSIEKWRTRLELQTAAPWSHWVAHISMLHGAIPTEILPGASRTVLAPSWSISLEWQFYILAPLSLAVEKDYGMGVSVFCFRTFTVHLQNWRTGHVRRFIFRYLIDISSIGSSGQFISFAVGCPPIFTSDCRDRPHCGHYPSSGEADGATSVGSCVSLSRTFGS
jgi:hypothetical protein